MTTQQATQTLAQLIQAQRIGFRCVPADSNPNSDSDTWRDGASHWRCVITRAGRRMTVPFSQGAAHTQPPTLEDVLDCLALDASGYENARGFADWCSEYGYDTDSRKAERTWKAVVRQSVSLGRLLGAAIYEVLLYHTERA